MTVSSITKRMRCVVLAFGCLTLSADFVRAEMINTDKNISWASRRDLTSQQFSQWFDTYRKRGLMMIDVDAYPHGSGVRYSMIWRANPDGRGWAEYRDMTSDQYNKRWREFRSKRYRPIDVETYVDRGRRKWAGIWMENKEGLAWSSHRNLDGDAYGKMFQEKSKAGFRLVDVEVYRTGNSLRYASIWVRNKDGRAWAQLRNMTRTRYQREVNERGAKGFNVVDFEAYDTPSGMRYAAIWERKPGFAWQTRTNRTAQQFWNMWRQYRDEGYRLIDFERYNTPSGRRYAGIWAENNTRLFRYARKGVLDQRVEGYRAANNLPGISVAIIRNGTMIYRRGFGDADVGRNKDAHGETVYSLASVSKVIGGTLAAKLENEGRLRSGRRFRLNLENTTRTYLNMPNHHTHTVAQLYSHLSCVAHYPSRTTPGIANQTTHYRTATAASQAIWATGLVTDTNPSNANPNQPCTIGTTYSYSTPAFTFGAAVLEQATGQTVVELLDNEIFRPHGLSSMRVQYASSRLPANGERAVPYTNSNNATNYTNSSWKVFGGGIESNVVDLARFGWKVLNTEILNEDARDNRLWTRVNLNRTHGIGWAIVNDPNGRRLAQWNGSWTGARALLRAYRDDGLIIAIASNRTNHTQQGDVGGLADALGNIVLN